MMDLCLFHTICLSYCPSSFFLRKKKLFILLILFFCFIKICREASSCGKINGINTFSHYMVRSILKRQEHQTLIWIVYVTVLLQRGGLSEYQF